MGFGWWASLLEQRLNGQQAVAIQSLWRGGLATLVAVMPAVVLAILLQFLLEGWLWLLTQVAGVWLAISLRGLAEHGRAARGVGAVESRPLFAAAPRLDPDPLVLPGA